MTAKLNPAKVLEDITPILTVWKANPKIEIEGFTQESVGSAKVTLDATLTRIADLELQLTPLRNTRDDTAHLLNEACTRFRAAAKGVFGPNSSQYEQAGGTRAVERKSPTRKAKALAKPAA